MRKIVLIFIFISLLAACGTKEDFKSGHWGMTMDEVILLEKENGNELYTERNVYDDRIELIYEDISINGHLAEVTYAFDQVYMKIPEDEELEEGLTAEEFMEKIETLNLKDTVLVMGQYKFNDLSTDDEEELFESLTSKYGKPDEGETPYDSEVLYAWMNDRTVINYWGQYSEISYFAQYEAMEDFLLINHKGKNKRNDL